MLFTPASYTDERRNFVEAGIQDVLDSMHTGRLKVFEHLNAWFEEFELYHRDNGKIVKERDDLLDATRYAIMSLRSARAKAERTRARDDYGWNTTTSAGSGWSA
jgi:hypothetical protein